MLDNLYLKLAFLVAFIALLVSQTCLHFYLNSYDEFESEIVPENIRMSTNTIESLGYKFNEEGQLRKYKKSKITKKPFKFKISRSHAKNQANYENLGAAITEYVYQLLETEVGLKKIYTDRDPQSFFYASEDALTNKEKLLILIHGSGVVRAGQWARSVIINDNLNAGSQLPYIKRAQSLGYAIIVLNSNHEWKDPEDEKPVLNPLAHAQWVWKEFISKCPAKFQSIVAHSSGGFIAIYLARKLPEFRQKIQAVAMTDAEQDYEKRSQPMEEFLLGKCQNWITSLDPVGSYQMTKSLLDIPSFSAGTDKHEYTSHVAIDSIFEYFDTKYLEYLRLN